MGLAVDSSNPNHLYVSTTDGPFYRGAYEFYYNYTSHELTEKEWYAWHYEGDWDAYDIGYMPNISGAGDIIIATDDASYPIRRISSPNGNLVSTIPASIGIGSTIRGVTVDSDNYIWASNPNTSKIYKIGDLIGIEDTLIQVGRMQTIAVDCNPFHHSVSVNLTGVTGTSSLEILDISGRTVHTGTITEEYIWDAAAAPTGSYIIRVTTPSCNTLMKNVLKL